MTDSNNLVELLKLFNRKERYWCIQNLIEDPNTLNKELLEECGIPNGAKPEEIYWAMDYHINWIYAVLYLIKNGYSAKTAKQLEKKIDDETINSHIENNQEDFDILLAYQNKLILIEAKFDSNFDKKQYKNKMKHYTNFQKYINNKLDIKFILYSPKLKPPKFKDKNIKVENYIQMKKYGNGKFLIVKGLDRVKKFLTVTGLGGAKNPKNPKIEPDPLKTS